MSPDEVRVFVRERGPGWVRQQAELHGRQARALNPESIAHLAPFFGPDAERARLTIAAIENPPFYPELLERGADPRDLLYFDRLDAITFGQVVVFRPNLPGDVGLLFHELVHVTQTRLLGIDRLAEAYVDGWFAGRERFFEDPVQRYLHIPLEASAYELDRRYRASPATVFSVEAALRELLPGLL